jgi:HSP20 family protein
MNGIVKWNPSSRLLGQAFGPNLSRFLDDAFERSARGLEEDASATNWAPAADIKETEAALFVQVELPGLTKEDIDVSLEANVLTVSGERRFTKDESKETYHRLERFYGKFSRSFRLPRKVDAGSVKASFADGLLVLELPKTEESRPRHIAIN